MDLHNFNYIIPSIIFIIIIVFTNITIKKLTKFVDKVGKVSYRVLTILFTNISQFKSIRLSCEVGYRDEQGQNDINFIFFKLQCIIMNRFFLDKIIYTNI